MTLETGVKALAEAVAVDVKALEDGKANSLHSHLIGDVTGLSPRLNSIGNLNKLQTSNKTNLVAAINELAQSFAELIPQIDDDAGLGDTNVTWSADKSSRELADIGSMIGDVESVLVAINGEP